jgi:hypothetical protein
MATAQSFIDDVRARLVEANQDFFQNDTSILRWLNHGYRNFVAKSKCLEKIKGYNLTANQYEYALPADYLHITQMRWEDRYFVRERDMEEFSRYIGFNDQQTDRPRIYKIFPMQKTFRVAHIPNTTSASNTLNGAINSSVTTITLTDASSFPNRGRVLIDSEQILYYNKSGNNLQQCVRGDNSTTTTDIAASHNNGAAVQYLPLLFHYQYMPPDMVVSTVDCQLPVEYEEGIIAYATSVAFRAKDKYEVASQQQRVYSDILDLAIRNTAERQRDRLPVIKDDMDWDVF